MAYIRQLFVLLLISACAESQPYIDLINARYISSPGNQSASKDKNATTLNYLVFRPPSRFSLRMKKTLSSLLPFLNAGNQQWTQGTIIAHIITAWSYL